MLTRRSPSSPHLATSGSSPSQSTARNYRFTRDGRDLLATLVHVPELDGTFLEIETVVAETRDIDSALTAELYTDAVRERRQMRR